MLSAAFLKLLQQTSAALTSHDYHEEAIERIRNALKKNDKALSEKDELAIVQFYYALAKETFENIQQNYYDTSVVTHRNPDYLENKRISLKNPATIKVMAYTFAETFAQTQHDFLTLLAECPVKNEMSATKAYQLFSKTAISELAVIEREVNERKNPNTLRGSRGVLDHVDIMARTQTQSPLKMIELRDERAVTIHYTPIINENAAILAHFKKQTAAEQCADVQMYLNTLKTLFCLAEAKKVKITDFVSYADTIVTTWKKASLLLSYLPWESLSEKKAAHQHLFNLYVLLEDYGWRCENGKTTGLQNNNKAHYTLFISAIEGVSLLGDARDPFAYPLKQLAQLMKKCNQLKKKEESLTHQALETSMDSLSLKVPPCASSSEAPVATGITFWGSYIGFLDAFCAKVSSAACCG